MKKETKEDSFLDLMMAMDKNTFENIQINGYTYATRYIASWIKVGGKFDNSENISLFYHWLKSEGLTDNEAVHIKNLAINSKDELEYSAKEFLSAINK